MCYIPGSRAQFQIKLGIKGSVTTKAQELNWITGRAAEHFLNKRLLLELVLTHLKARQKQFNNILCVHCTYSLKARCSHAVLIRQQYIELRRFSHQTVSSLCVSASAPSVTLLSIKTDCRTAEGLRSFHFKVRKGKNSSSFWDEQGICSHIHG